jgi:hypothetical protein
MADGQQRDAVVGVAARCRLRERRRWIMTKTRNMRCLAACSAVAAATTVILTACGGRHGQCIEHRTSRDVQYECVTYVTNRDRNGTPIGQSCSSYRPVYTERKVCVAMRCDEGYLEEDGRCRPMYEAPPPTYPGAYDPAGIFYCYHFEGGQQVSTCGLFTGEQTAATRTSKIMCVFAYSYDLPRWICVPSEYQCSETQRMFADNFPHHRLSACYAFTTMPSGPPAEKTN